MPSTVVRSHYRLLLVTLFLLCCSAFASNPKQLAPVATALQSAQTVYVVETPLPTFAPAPPNPRFLQFYDGLQHVGRYKFVAGLPQADLLLSFGITQGRYRLIISDARTLQIVGVVTDTHHGLFSHKGDEERSTENVLAQTVALFAGSRLNGPTPPAVPYTQLPGPVTLSEESALLKQAKTVLLLDKGSHTNQIAVHPGELAADTLSALQALGRYQVVQTTDAADLILRLDGVDVGACAPNSEYQRKNLTYACDYYPDQRIQLEVLDPHTLQLVTIFSVTAQVSLLRGRLIDPAYDFNLLVKKLAAEAGPVPQPVP